MKDWDYVVVGAGLFGSVFAQRMVEMGRSAVVLDRRDHIGGNCYTYLDQASHILVHKYGTHIFHTNDERVWWYVNRFTEFNSYHHCVWSRVGDRTYPIPVNLHTLNLFFNLDLTPETAVGFLERLREDIPHPRNLEEKALSLVGRDLYFAFFEGYTRKHWGCEPSELPPSIISRLPVRTSYDNGYFTDRYQGIPVDGYTPMFERMLKGADVELHTDFLEDRAYWTARARRKVVYSGPLDAYFRNELGRLNWRSVYHEVKHHEVEDVQGCAVLNTPDRHVGHTRVHEPRHLHPERFGDLGAMSLTQTEYSRDGYDNPAYPVNAPIDQELCQGYRALTRAETNVIFGGRLARYVYHDMHQVIGAALAAVDKEFGP